MLEPIAQWPPSGSAMRLGGAMRPTPAVPPGSPGTPGGPGGGTVAWRRKRLLAGREVTEELLRAGPADLNTREQLVEKLFQAADLDQSGRIDWSEFLRMVRAMSETYREDELARMFEARLAEHGYDPASGFDRRLVEAWLSDEEGGQASDNMIRSAIEALDRDRSSVVCQEVALPSAGDQIGLTFESLPPARAIIKEVAPASWADDMGFQTGDELVALGGVAVSTMSAEDFRRALHLQRPKSFFRSATAPVLSADEPARAARGSLEARVAELEARQAALQAKCRQLQADLDAVKRDRCPEAAARAAGEEPGCAGHAPAASFLHRLGGFAAVEPRYRRAFEAREELLGVDHPETLAALAGLASLMFALGKAQEAETLRERLLDRLLCGQDGFSFGGSLSHGEQWLLRAVNNLAVLLKVSGLPRAAEPLQRWELRAGEAKLGEGHPETLTSVTNLALLLDSLGDLGEAEALHRRALACREKLFGPGHPATQRSRSGLESVLLQTGRKSEAAALQVTRAPAGQAGGS